MQRSSYAPPPANSPPLHHPVPQHVSTVPMMRSPPPPQSSSSYTSSPYGGQSSQPAQGAAGPYASTLGGFMNDPTTQMGLQLGQGAMKVGQDYIDQNVGRYFSVGSLKPYFDVTTPYVLRKLLVLLFPFRHHPWSRSPNHPSSHSSRPSNSPYASPRDDINAPDMYIPLMALVTYILLSTLLAGIRGEFRPDLMGLTATTAFVILLLEIAVLKLGAYILNISSESQILDLVAYSGYKFFGVIFTVGLAEIANGGRGTGGWIGWSIFLYAFAANALFLLRSLKYVLLPDSSTESAGPGMGMGEMGGMGMVGQRMPMPPMARSQRNRRTQFLFFYSYIVQFVFMWILTRQPGGAKKITS